MDNVHDWDQLLNSPDGASYPEKPLGSSHQAEAELAVSRKPLLTEFGSTAAYTSELDAKAHEDVTMYVIDEQLDEVIKLYNKLDRGIENGHGHFGRFGLMDYGNKIKAELELGLQRFARRGTGATEEIFTIQSTRQGQRY